MSEDKESTNILHGSGFHEAIAASIKGYQGEYAEIIRHTPDLFKLFTNLLEDPMVPNDAKPIINAAIAYFVAPFDALPEEIYGPVGYLDDLYLSVWALNQLEERLGYAILENNWEGSEELSTVMDRVYEKTKGIVGEMEKDILEYVGLV